MKNSILDSLGVDYNDDSDDLYNLQDDDEDDITEPTPEDIRKKMEELNVNLSSLKEAKTELRNIPDITEKRKALNELATKAEKRFDQVVSIALNSDPRFAAAMLQAATSILKISLDSHAKVVDSDIKLIDLQMRKDKFELEFNSKNQTQPQIEPEKNVGGLQDRNAILSRLKDKNAK